MPLALLLFGAVIGAIAGHGFDGLVAGAFFGFAAGYVLDTRRRMRPPADADPLSLLDPRVAERVRAMERRIGALETALRRAGRVADASGGGGDVRDAARTGDASDGSAGDVRDATRTGDASAAAGARPAPPAVSEAPTPLREPTPASTPDAVNASTSPTREDERLATDALRRDAHVPAVPAYGARRAAVRTSPPDAHGAIWRFLTGGNALARIGVVVLFIGVAFLLKYASEHVSVPIEVRLAAVAAGGVALLAFGWRLRARRTGYGMTLQGAAVGILYLTVFAALRLYQLLPPFAAFTLLFGIGALSSFLAIRQDAVALAVLGILGGFAAPVLTSSGGGSHVMLFSYCALLNAAILAIAWFKAWRLLNVVGFACTFAVGFLWGITWYRPEDFATTEPFLILFFLFYVAIATLHALRRSLQLSRYVDGTLVFGTPLVAAGLQSMLVHDIEYAMAWSALVAAAIYLALARLLHARRGGLPLLVEAFLALGIAFATLAVPLALDARLTSATWALEGAALVWVGVRQTHLRARVSGLLLQFAAAIAFALGFSPWTARPVHVGVPVLNGDCIGAALVACAALASSRMLARATAVRAWERILVPLVFGWGLLWWVGAGWHEIDRFVAPATRSAVLVVFLAGSAALFAGLAARFDWPMARVPAYVLPGALLSIAIVRIVDTIAPGAHLLAAGGYIAWPLALLVEALLLRHFERMGAGAHARAVDAGHAIAVWVVTLVAADALGWLAMQVSGAVWRLVPWGFVPALMLMAIASVTLRGSWPFGTHARAYLRGGGVPVAAGALAWTLYANIKSSGDPAPLPFVPLVNPIDVTQALVIVGAALWLRRMRQHEAPTTPGVSADALGAGVAVLLLFWVTCSTLRAVHHYADVPWSLAPLWASRVAQAALSIVWSLFALAAMIIANRRRYRVAWVVGAALLGVVVAKLFVVDLSQVGGIERIVSFIGVGALLLVVGYVAPVPPRRETH